MDFKGNSQEELYSINFPPLCIERMDEITSLIAQKVNEICCRHNNILAAGVACFGPLLYENGDVLFEPVNTESHRDEASVLAMMLSSGFPLEQALEMVPLVLPDAEAAGEIAKIREKMGEGVSFSDALTGSAMFDEIHRQMLRMGIAAGREDQVMSKIAQTYEQQVEESISGLVSIIEPTMVAALSIVIGAVLLSVMMPMAGIISSIL